VLLKITNKNPLFNIFFDFMKFLIFISWLLRGLVVKKIRSNPSNPSNQRSIKKMNHLKNLTLFIIGNGSTILQNTDDYLVQQFQTGDRDAFTHLVHRHKRDVFRFVLSKVKDPELASDLTQDVFVKLFKSAALYQPKGKFRSWLFRMAQNICIDAYRKQNKATVLSLYRSDDAASEQEIAVIDQIEDESSNPEKDVEFIELQDAIEHAFNSLPEKQRTALILCQYHGMSYREIASIEKVPVGTIKSRIHNALTSVRQYLKEQDLIER